MDRILEYHFCAGHHRNEEGTGSALIFRKRVDRAIQYKVLATHSSDRLGDKAALEAVMALRLKTEACREKIGGHHPYTCHSWHSGIPGGVTVLTVDEDTQKFIEYLYDKVSRLAKPEQEQYLQVIPPEPGCGLYQSELDRELKPWSQKTLKLLDDGDLEAPDDAQLRQQLKTILADRDEDPRSPLAVALAIAVGAVTETGPIGSGAALRALSRQGSIMGSLMSSLADPRADVPMSQRVRR